jgi:hypothetical protein
VHPVSRYEGDVSPARVGCPTPVGRSWYFLIVTNWPLRIESGIQALVVPPLGPRLPSAERSHGT